MGYRFAVANGNWSTAATWDQNTIPVAGDVVTANNFTVTVDTNINVATLSTLATDNPGIIPVMTGASAPAGYTASASTTSGSQFPYLAFDKNASTFYLSATNVSVAPQQIQIQIPVATVVNRYRFRGDGATAGRTANNWTFEGSNNGSTWVVLHTVTAGSPGATAYYTSPLIGNVTAYLYYRINVSATATTANPVAFSEIILLDTAYSTASGVSGGGFNVTGTRTITLTSNDQFLSGQAIIAGTTTTITYSGVSGTTFTLSAGANVGQFVRSLTTAAASCVTVSSNGTMNATGLIPVSTNTVTSNAISITGANSITSFTGNIVRVTGSAGRAITTTVACTLTIIGDIEGCTGNDGHSVLFSGSGTLNITGNLTTASAGAANRCSAVYITSTTGTTTVNITGNVTGPTASVNNTVATLINGASNNASVYITGSVIGGPVTTGSSAWAVYIGNLPAGASAGTGYTNIVGPITAGYVGPAVQSAATTSINLFTGPFISNTYGMFPFYVARMHYIVTPSSYFEFRNSTTNGALPPGAIAPAAYMYDPSVISGAPTANNVRSGVVYASGSQTGTLVVPAASSVAAGVVFDNGTIGTAVLTQAAVSAAVWNELVANLTTANSIGLRMSSCSTVATTGAQITSLT